MDESAGREVIHKVNNLLTVIYTQAAVARAAGTLAAHERALASIESSAQATTEVLAAARRAGTTDLRTRSADDTR